MSFDPKRGRLRAGASVCALTLFLVPGAPASADEVVPPALPQVVPELSSDTCVSASEEVIDQEVWTENALGLPYARTTSSGEGTNVAVLGSGVDDTPAALAGAVAEGGEDCTGFGTFLAGVVAARPQSDSGLVGVAPEARVTAVPVTDERGRSDADALAEGMTEAVSEGADVVLVGVALPIGSSDLDAAVDTAEAENVLVVAPSTARVQSEVHAAAPATRSEVLGVVANGTDGSVHGEAPTEDGGNIAAPDLSTPGEAVLSVVPGGDGHAVAEGDVVAAAFVAGTAALVRSRHPELSAAQTAERLTSSAYPYTGHGAGPGSLDPVGALSRTLGPRSEEGPRPEALALDRPVEPTKGRVLTLVGGTALLVTMVGVGAAAARRRRTRTETEQV